MERGGAGASKEPLAAVNDQVGARDEGRLGAGQEQGGGRHVVWQAGPPERNAVVGLLEDRMVLSGFCVSGVSVMPGDRALTRMPSAASSRAAARTIWFTAALVAEYAVRPGSVLVARIDETTRIERSSSGRPVIIRAAPGSKGRRR
jgi:hypothetical protein